MSQKHNRSLGHIELTEKQAEFHKIMRNPRTRLYSLVGQQEQQKHSYPFIRGYYKYYEDSLINILYLRSLAESADKGMGFLKEPWMISLGHIWGRWRISWRNYCFQQKKTYGTKTSYTSSPD